MKPHPFATLGRVLFALFLFTPIFALPARSATCTSPQLSSTDPTAYIATAPNLVTVLDASSNAICTVAVGSTLTSAPGNLAVTPDGRKLFVENDSEASVSVVDLSTGSVTNISLTTSGVTAPMTANLAVSPDGNFVYVVSLPQTLIIGTTTASLTVINVSTMTASAASGFNGSVSNTPVTGAGLGIAFTPDATKAYIATEGLTYVVSGGASPAISTTIAVSGGSVAMDPNGAFAYVVDVAPGANTVSKIDTTANTFSSLSPSAVSPSAVCTLADAIAITPNSNFAYYTCPGDNFVQKIDTSTNTVAATILLASTAGPHGVAITSDGASVFTANNSGQITVISVSGNSVSGSFTASGANSGIGFRPVQLAFSPAAQSIPTGKTFNFAPTLTEKFAFGAPVVWSVSCTAGGAACGTINASSGLYAAPNSIPSPNDVKVIATSSEIPVKSLLYPLQSVSAVATVTPSQLVFTTQPANGTAGSPLGAVQVAVEDASGNIDTTSTVMITIASSSSPLGAAPLTPSSTVTVQAVNGVATFNNLDLTQVGTTPLATTQYAYTLTATSVSTPPPTLTPALSNPFAIAPGPATQLVFSTQPTNGTIAGNPLVPAVVVYVEDAFNNVVTSGPGSNASITMTPASVPSGAGFFAASTNPVPAVGGVATFSNLILTKANIPPASGSTIVTPYSYTLQAASAAPALTSGPSTPFSIAPAGTAALVFTTPPTNGTAGVPLANVIVAVEDNFGNVVTSSNAPVTMTPNSIPSGAAFTGASTNPVPAAGGIATFSNLVLNIANIPPISGSTTVTTYNYTLTATAAPALTTGPSGAIAIAPNSATQLIFTTQPTTGPLGGNTNNPQFPTVVVCVEDAFNNVVTASAAPVTISSTPANVGGTVGPAAAVNGVAAFSSLQFTIAGTYTLTAKSGILTSATSNPFTLTTNITVTISATFTSGASSSTVKIEDLPAGTDTFKATVTADPNNPALGTAVPPTGVTWAMINCGAGTLALCGTINPNTGAYTPVIPVPVIPNNTFMVQATSITDPTKISPPLTVTITSNIVVTIATATIAPGGGVGPIPLTITTPPVNIPIRTPVTFTATTADAANPNVVWTTCGAGAASCGAFAGAIFTPPSQVPGTPAITITSTSTADPNKTKTLTVTTVGESAQVDTASTGSAVGTPVNIASGATLAVGTLDLLGPGPADGTTFTITCGTITLANVSCAPSPTTTTGTASGATPFTVTFTVVRATALVPVEPNIPSSFGPRTQYTNWWMLALLFALVFFGLWWIRWVQISSPRVRRGFAFVFLLFLSVGWMSACTQFSAPNFPGTPVNPTPLGNGSAIITITPSGLGPGGAAGDNFTTRQVTVFFKVN